jgi:6-hydroxytryprostatin B O-methyltransferase
MAMTSNLFFEPKPNHIAHTATSALLVTNESLRDWAVFMSETTVPAASKLVEASERWPDSVQKNETAYNVAFDTDLPFFDHLKTQPDKTRQFASYMKNVQKSDGTAIRHLVNGFEWKSLGKATVVDVGTPSSVPE